MKRVGLLVPGLLVHGLLVLGLLVLGFVVAPIGIAAQSGAQVTQTVNATSASGRTQWTTRTLSPEEIQRLFTEAGRMSSSCPVSLSARQAGTAYNRQVSGGLFSKDGKETGQSVHLSVTPRDAHQVVSAMVTVHGYANKKRMVQTLETQAQGAENDGDAERTLYARFASPSASTDASGASAELALPGFSAVTFLELKSIVYADGSEWKLAAGSACRARIDPLMLVDGR
jgi:hypothetical protein